MKQCLSSQQVQKEDSRVRAGTKKVLFGDRKDIHFKKYMDFDTVSGKANTNGVKFDRDTLSISWLGLSIPCRQPGKASDAAYTAESLDHKVSYCEVVRKMFPNGWRYYVTVCLDGPAPIRTRMGDGDAPLKHRQPVLHHVGRREDGAAKNRMGIDPGVSTIAGVSSTTAVLEELAPGCQRYAKEITDLQEKMDRSRRASNPDKYGRDGRGKRGCKGKWGVLQYLYQGLQEVEEPVPAESGVHEAVP